MLETRASIRGNGYTVELATARWPRPIEYAWASDSTVLTMIFGQRAYKTEGRYTELDEPGFQAMGNIFLLPPGRELLGRGPGGEHGVVRCLFGPELDHGLHDRIAGMARGQLKKSLDVGTAMVTTLMRRLAREASRPQCANTALIDSIASILLIECGNQILDDSAPLPRPACWEGGHGVQAFVDDFLQQGQGSMLPTAKRIARLSGYSPSYFAKLFFQDSGRTLGSYIADAQMRRAETLLLKTDLPLKHITQQLGFANAANFSNAFRRSFGMSPGRYRLGQGNFICRKRSGLESP